MKNPLLINWETPPFAEIKNEHYLPAFEETIKIAKSDIEKIISNSEDPNFFNTIVALDRSGKQLELVSDIFFNILECNGDEEMHKIAEIVQPMLVEYGNDIFQNEQLFAKVKVVYDNYQKEKTLDREDEILLKKTFDSFTSGGANLQTKEKVRYRQLTMKLANCQLDFGQRALKATNAWFIHLDAESPRIAGIPADNLFLAKQKAEQKGLEGYVFDLSAPDVNTVLTYADDRALREEVYIHSSKKSFRDDFDNCENICEILKCREEIAKLLGYNNYAEYALRNRMAKKIDQVYELLDQLRDASYNVAKKEIADLVNYAKSLGFKDLFQRWDLAYYMEKMRRDKFSVDQEKLKAYFPLNQVIDGVLNLASELFGIKFIKSTSIQVYHSDVQVFEVYDKDKFMAYLYLDFHPRTTKRSGAWMTEFRNQYINSEGEDVRPLISLVMNFTPPTEKSPSLLTFSEVNTFLHEFGHALNGMLSEVKYSSLSGTHSPRDFVELPSQLNENWLTEPEFLKTFAKHYKTGELIPQEYISQLEEMKKFMAGYACVRQLSFGYLDMMYHTVDANKINDILELERSVFNNLEVLPVVEGACMSTSFGHLFSGGYAAGYYGYKWAEMLEADAFAEFKENGVMDKATAARYRETILSKGGSVDAMQMFVNFRGREPQIKALLERDGLL